jgi:hypothetical protein
MQSPLKSIVCDGCGRPASPEHIAERLARLEFATRFRPVHMNVLFVALAPMPRPEDDFYGPPQSGDYFERLMDALDIGAASVETSGESGKARTSSEKLTEFQRKGCFMAYLSECPIPDDEGSAAEVISALGLAVVRRIRFNYKPKHVALLESNLEPLVGDLQKSGMGTLLLLDHGHPLAVPGRGDLPARAGFRTALGTTLPTGATHKNHLSEYDRMQCNQG